MPDDVIMEVQNHQASWMSNWFKWCPTSMELLREAEKRILENLTTLGAGKYVELSCIPDMEKESSQVWTLRANTGSPNTPLLLLHGFGSGSALWCLNIDALAAHRPVYAMDILGFGRSSRPKFHSDAIHAEKQFISSIEGWREALGLEKFILLGHSFGGFLAASYAIKYPDRVAHLVLADPWGFPERPLDVDERYNLPLWAKALGTVAQYFNPLSILRLAGPLGPGILQKARPDMTKKFAGLLPNADEAIPSYLYHCNAQTPSGESAFHSLMSGFGWAKFPMFHRLDALQQEVPITLIYGSRSWVDRDPGFQIKYSRQNSYVDVQILQGAGHHVYADRADRFNTLVNKIGKHVDSGTLPDLPSAEPYSSSARDTGAFSVNDTLNKFINVRHDTVQGRIDADDSDDDDDDVLKEKSNQSS
uniref:1-acylglycerol-3-phosphate O-acyltransferase ABHD5 n=1 Tax=Hirondellea gigas TaxID=1518452 RepID=A0A2P2I194_9CRUS